jgi:beta-xylosidase
VAAALTLALSLMLAGCSSVAATGALPAPGGSRPPASSTTTTLLPPTTIPPPPGRAKTPAGVVIRQNLPDPVVLKVPGGYELYASQTGISSPIIPTAFSTTLYHWPAVHSAMRAVPPWATLGFTWAPDVRHVDGRYVMYFDSIARPSLYFDRAANGFSRFAQCIGLATSRTPGGPFVGRASPLICDFHAHGDIDPRTFLASDGRLYLDWKSDDNAAYPGAFPPTHLYAQQLSSNGLSLKGPPHLLLSATEPWQKEIVEAPDMVKVRGRYWLLYSGSWFDSPGYGIGLALCEGPIGPCRDLSAARPWVASNRQGPGPGEESLFEDTNGQWWMLYSLWYFGWLGRAYRPVGMAPLGFSIRGPYIAAPPATVTS